MTNVDSTPVWSGMSIGASNNSSRSSPWESPAKNQSAPFASNAGAAAFAGNSGGGGGMEDEFDLLSTSRSKSPANAHPPQSQQPLLHHAATSTPHPISGENIALTSSSGGNPWDLSGLSQSMGDSACQSPYQPARRKSPKEFLGENASLVNLDNLVARPASAASANPFVALATTNRSPSPATNPFAAQQQAGRHTPMNQIPTSTTAFVQGIWGDPSHTPAQPSVAPMYTAGTAASSYPPGYNPFL